jgi:hypothetical protein
MRGLPLHHLRLARVDGLTRPAARDPASRGWMIATAVGSQRDYLVDKRRGLEY